MGEGSSDNRAASSTEGPSRSKSVGRRIATVVVWLAMGYAVAVGLISVIPRVFWPTASEQAQKAVPDSCRAGVRDLKSELLERASGRIAAGGVVDGGESLRRWTRDWNDRYTALGSQCQGPGHAAHDSLGRLRHRVVTLLERFDREQAPLAHEIDRTLESLPTSEKLPHDDDDNDL